MLTHTSITAAVLHTCFPMQLPLTFLYHVSNTHCYHPPPKNTCSAVGCGEHLPLMDCLRYYVRPTDCLSVIQYVQRAPQQSVSEKKAKECSYRVGVCLVGVEQDYTATFEALYGTPMCDDPRKPQRQRLDPVDNEGRKTTCNKPSICKKGRIFSLCKHQHCHLMA